MKVVHLSQSDGNGGAPIAAYRLHRALRGAGVNSHMAVDQATTGDWSVAGPRGPLGRISASLRPRVGAAILRAAGPGGEAPRSVGVLPGGLNRRLKGANIAHLHWVNSEMTSIAEIGRIAQPVVWTLHDMWPFCGTEHYASGEGWKTARLGGLDRWTWRRKKRHWRQMQIVTPSRWLADRVAESALMADWPVRVIPNPIDLDTWAPADRDMARELLGLPRDRPIILFGAFDAGKDPRKGGDLLFAALGKLALSGLDADLAIFGMLAPKEPLDLGRDVHYLGRLHDAVTIRLAYAAADVFVLPSRQDNLPNTGVEATACGRPVVAFDTGGLSDIVRHEENGYLARAFDVDDLARGIAWVLEDQGRKDALSARARSLAEERFAAPVVADQYRALYGEIAETAA